MLDRQQKETRMESTCTTDDEQTTLWNGLAGHAWVALQEVSDSMFKPRFGGMVFKGS
jgi:hypothetical protein